MQTTPDAFENAFHAAAERHERVWVFMAIVLVTLLFIVTGYLVARDYGVVVQTQATYSNPNTPATLAEFQGKGIKQTGPHSYNVYMMGRVWSWSPSPISIPAGSTVTFYVTSGDVLHGFEVQDTDINVTAIPGVIAKVTYTFDKPGVFHIICNEYCGAGHQAMIGRINVTRSAT